MAETLDERRARLQEIWLQHVNTLLESGEDEAVVAETLLVAGLGVAITQDGHRATARNLYMTSLRVAEMAERNEDADALARAEMRKAGLRLN